MLCSEKIDFPFIFEKNEVAVTYINITADELIPVYPALFFFFFFFFFFVPQLYIGFTTFG